jgi:hypothetical protein
VKGAEWSEELAALPEGVRVVATTPVTVPFLDARRAVVVLQEA